MGNMRRKLTRVRRFRATRIDDSQPIQTVQAHITSRETPDQIERYQNYGFTSVPDCESGDGVAGLVISALGHHFVVGLEEPGVRPTDLAPADVMVFHREGHHFHLQSGGKGVFNLKKLVVNCPETEWNGDINQKGKHTSTGDQVADGVSQTKHKHKGDSNGTTGSPIK